MAIASRVCSYLDAKEGLVPDERTRGWSARLITQLRLSIPREPPGELPPARLVFGHVRSLYEEAERLVASDSRYFGNDHQLKPDTATAVQRFIVSSLVSLLWEQCTRAAAHTVFEMMQPSSPPSLRLIPTGSWVRHSPEPPQHDQILWVLCFGGRVRRG